MSDDLDDLLRRSMKTLDDQVPSGYFEGLPQRTLARLEDSSMQTTGTSSSSNPSTVAPPPPAAKDDRDEDSGLHDIRSLASSTKLRLSSRRSTQNPVVREDDILASSSAGWKNVALPEPAKMVSLPDLADLPTKAEIEALDKAAQKRAKAEAKASAKAPKAEKAADQIEVAAPVAAIHAAAPAVATPSAPAFGARIAAQQSSGGRGKMIALLGLGASAAAAAVFFLVINKSDTSESSLKYESKASAPLPAMTAKQLPAPAAVATVEPIGAGSAAAVEPPPVAEPVVERAATKADKGEKPGKVHKVEIRDTMPKDTKPVEKPVVAPKDEIKKTGEDGEPSFDALLKEAGVSDQKKTAKVTLEKKSLSGGDIKTGMGSVAGKAAKCYAGTQGTAAVKLTVAPSGEVSKVTVTGVFAGTPVAACVESAVKSASFPAWDGGPQSFGYSYLLAE